MDEILSRKRWLGESYTEQLKDLTAIELQVEEPWARSVFWMYGLVIREETGLDARELAARLAERGVETRPFFFGMHAQPVLRERGLFVGEEYPVADRLAQQGLYLPSGLAMDQRQLDYVCQALRQCLS